MRTSIVHTVILFLSLFYATSLRAQIEVKGGKVGIGNTAPKQDVHITADTLIIEGKDSTSLMRLSGSNIALGEQSGSNILSGDSNVFLGSQSGRDMTSGYRNNFIGRFAGRLGLSGDDNNFLGHAAGLRNSGSKNNYIGKLAGSQNTTGSQNTFIGYQTGQSNTTGNSNLAIGDQAASTAPADLSYWSAIGYNAQPTKSQQIVLGAADNQEVVLHGEVVMPSYDENAAAGTPTAILGVDATGKVVQTDASVLDEEIWSETGVDAYYNAGNVGIGTDAPEKLLHIVTPSEVAEIKLESTFAGGRNTQLRLKNDTKEVNLQLTAAGRMVHRNVSDGSVPFSIDMIENDNIGFGIENPTEKVHVQDDQAKTTLLIENTSTEGDPQLAFGISGTKVFSIGVDNSDGDKLKIGGSDIQTNSHMTIDATGNVGIGTSEPEPNEAGAKAVHINDPTPGTDGRSQVRLTTGATGTNANRGGVVAYDGSHDLTIGSYENVNGEIKFEVDDSKIEAMRISNDGNVGIGTTTPTEKLEVEGKAKTDQLQVTTGAADGHVLQSDASGNATWVDPSTLAGTNDGYIAGAGTHTAGGDLDMNGQSVIGIENMGVGTSTPTSKLQIVEDHNQLPGYASATPGFLRVGTPHQELAIGSSASLGNRTTWLQGRHPSSSFDISYDLSLNPIGGNVGIGTSTPTEKLEVAGTTKTDQLQVTTGATDGHILQSDASGNATWVDPSTLPGVNDNLGNHTAAQNINLNGKWISGDGGNEGIQIDGSGKVGIGTISPASKLHVGSEGDWLTMGSRPALSQNYYGYGGQAYKVLQLGNLTSNTSNISLGADVTGNSSGQFNGRNVIVANDSKLIAPNASNSDYRGILRIGSDDKLYLGGSGTKGYEPLVISTNDNVGIGTTTPAAKLTLSNNVASGSFDNFSEYQMLLYDSGSPASSFGLGIRPGTMAFNSASQYDFDVNGSTKFQMLSTGQLKLNTYTDASHNGTLSSILGVDASGNVIKTDASALDFDELWSESGNDAYYNAGNVGIGITSPTTALDIKGGATNTNSLRLRSGGTAGDVSSKQLLLSYANTTGYTHGMSSRHHSQQKSGNAIDFWLWNHGTDGVNDMPSLRAMTIDGTGHVGIGTSTPSKDLTIKKNGATLRLETASNPSAYYAELKSNYDSGNRGSLNFGGTYALGYKTIGGSHRTYLNNYYGLAFSTGATDPTDASIRMAISQNGNVGVGTYDPSKLFHVQSNHPSNNNYSVAIDPAIDGPTIDFGQNGDDSYMNIGQYGSDNNIDTKTSDFNIFSTAAPDALVLKHDSGNVGIGTNNPESRLHVASATNNFKFLNGGSDLTPNLSVYSNSGKAIAIGSGANASFITFDESGFFGITKKDKTSISSGAHNGGIPLLLIQNTGQVQLNEYAGSTFEVADNSSISHLGVDGLGNIVKITPTSSAKTNNSEELGKILDHIQSQDDLIDDLTKRLEDLENVRIQLENTIEVALENSIEMETPYISQNMPNPTANEATIKYFIPETASNATVRFFSLSGQVMKEVDIDHTGQGDIKLDVTKMMTGSYMYALIVDGELVDTKKMVIVK